jgi:hypothetical protein
MEIPKDLKNDIWDYCRANDISNIDEFIIKIIKQGFTSEKFGSTPVPTIKQKIVEVIKEVEVEKIVEIIKEIPIEKEVYITDDSQSKKLTEKIKKLEDEVSLSKKNAETTKKELTDALSKLELEKNKNKRDIYGE